MAVAPWPGTSRWRAAAASSCSPPTAASIARLSTLARHFAASSPCCGPAPLDPRRPTRGSARGPAIPGNSPLSSSLLLSPRPSGAAGHVAISAAAAAAATAAAATAGELGSGHLLFDSNGPNPHVVRMFLAEKGLLGAFPRQQVDIPGGENRRPPYSTEVNTRGQSPALRLPSGDVLCEILAICEYIEEAAPLPALVGSTAEGRGATRMWTRRVDLIVCEPMAAGFRFGAGREVRRTDRAVVRPCSTHPSRLPRCSSILCYHACVSLRMIVIAEH